MYSILRQAKPALGLRLITSIKAWKGGHGWSLGQLTEWFSDVDVFQRNGCRLMGWQFWNRCPGAAWKSGGPHGEVLMDVVPDETPSN